MKLKLVKTDMMKELSNVKPTDIERKLKVDRVTAWRKKNGTSKLTLAEAETLYGVGLRQAAKKLGLEVRLDKTLTT